MSKNYGVLWYCTFPILVRMPAITVTAGWVGACVLAAWRVFFFFLHAVPWTDGKPHAETARSRKARSPRRMGSHSLLMANALLWVTPQFGLSSVRILPTSTARCIQFFFLGLELFRRI